MLRLSLVSRAQQKVQTPSASTLVASAAWDSGVPSLGLTRSTTPSSSSSVMGGAGHHHHQRRLISNDATDMIMGVYSLEYQSQQDAAIKGNPSILLKIQEKDAAAARRLTNDGGGGGGSVSNSIPEYYFGSEKRVGVRGGDSTFSSEGLRVWSGTMPLNVRPDGWTSVPAGWCMLVETTESLPSSSPKKESTIPVTTDDDKSSIGAATAVRDSDNVDDRRLPALPIQKTFSLKSQNALYSWMGKVAWFADQVGVVPTIEWMWTEATVTIRPKQHDEEVTSTKQLPLEVVALLPGQEEVLVSRSQLVAEYMNDCETQLGLTSNMSAGTSKSERVWNLELDAKASLHSKENFCWINDGQAFSFAQETGMQWGNRADYLIARYSRQKKEFRKDLTLGKVIQEGKERRRRMERKKIKEVKREGVLHDMGIKTTSSEGEGEGLDERDVDSFSITDTIPRELREQMDHDVFSSDPYGHKPSPSGLETGDAQYSRYSGR